MNFGNEKTNHSKLTKENKITTTTKPPQRNHHEQIKPSRGMNFMGGRQF